MLPKSRYVVVQDRELHVTEWGTPGAEPLVMWHGLARTGRDFDDLAQVLADRYHIIAPDTLGRGLSQWSPNPAEEYQLSFYGQLATALVDHYGFQKMRWVGTSMGGAIGIKVASSSLQGRITHLVINDIGPQLAEVAVNRIRSYAGKPPEFDRVSELNTYLRTVYKPYGFATDDQWQRMADTSARRLPSGKVTTHYDPNMVLQFVHHPQDYDQWDAYDQVTAKTLVLRGADSDLLLPEWAEEMTRRGPKARLVTVPGCGHAPSLNVPEQTDLIAEFLAS